MIQIYGPEEIARIRESAQIVGRCLLALASEVRPGVSTLDLDKVAEKFIRDQGGEPAFLGYRGYPASICASVNEEVVHGIPTPKRILKQADVISLDIGVKKAGFYGDAARTFAVGTIAPELQRLLDTTERSLAAGIEKARPEGRVSDISAAIEGAVKADGFSVVRALVGHGVGRARADGRQARGRARP